MLFQCWASVEDGGPTLKQHWVNAPCLLGTKTCFDGGNVALIVCGSLRRLYNIAAAPGQRLVCSRWV